MTNTLDHRPEDKVINLAASIWWEHDKKHIYWTDTLALGK
jgi:hypothetical protein